MFPSYIRLPVLFVTVADMWTKEVESAREHLPSTLSHGTATSLNGLICGRTMARKRYATSSVGDAQSQSALSSPALQPTLQHAVAIQLWRPLAAYIALICVPLITDSQVREL